MKKFFIFIFILPLVIGCGKNNEIEIQSKWNGNIITADGNPADWQNFSMDYFKESGVSLGMKNDSENLYVLIKFRDEPLTRFLQSKVTLWLDKTAKKKKTFGISYMGKMPSRQMQGMGNEYQENIPEEEQGFERHHIMQDIMVMQKEESMDKSIPIPQNGKQGPAIGRNYDKGFCYHELKIPLQKNDSALYALGVNAGDTINIGVELGMEKDGRKRFGKDMPGGPPEGGMPGGQMGGGMGRGGPGDMGRGGPGGMPGEKGQMPEKKEIWLKLILAAGQEEDK